MGSKGNPVLAAGEMMGPYKVVRLIGTGGMGEVYEAVEPSIGRRVALKVINERGLESDEMVQRFLGEAKALAKLSHINVVNLYSFGQIGKQYYMAMEFIDGGGLDEFIKKTPYGIEDTLHIFRQLLEGMAAAHQQGIIHRDLKPHNVIIDKQKNIKIIDFGIAKQTNDQDGYKTATGMFLGTLNYLAPEIAKGFPPSTQTDIYGLGVILYEMLTGRVPFIGKNSFETLEMIRNKQIEFPKRIEFLLPDNVKRLIFKMTAKHLKDRYASIANVIEDLNRINLDDLPSELKAQSVRTHKVTNYEIIHKKLRARQFEDPEIKMIVNLACDIQSELDFDPSATLVVSADQPTIEVSELALKEAMERFSFVRSDLNMKKSMVMGGTQVPAVGRGKNAQDSWVTTFLMVSVLTLIAAGVFWKAVMRPTQTMVVKDVAANKTTAAPTLPGEGSRQTASQPLLRDPATDVEINDRGLDGAGRPLLAGMPAHRLGESYEFIEKVENEDGSARAAERSRRWTVSQDLGEDYAWMSDQGGYMITKRNPFVGPLQFLNSEDGQDFTELKVGSLHEPFPLEIGKKAEYTLIGKSIDESKQWRYTRQCQVLHYVKKIVAAGSFWTYEVECRQDDGKNTIESFYYSPQLRISVYRMIKSTQDGKFTRRIFELKKHSAAQ